MMVKVVENISRSNSDAIEVLEEALKMAKAGEILAVGVSWVTSDNSIGGQTSGSPNRVMMWGALELNAREFYKDVVVGED